MCTNTPSLRSVARQHRHGIAAVDRRVRRVATSDRLRAAATAQDQVAEFELTADDHRAMSEAFSALAGRRSSPRRMAQAERYVSRRRRTVGRAGGDDVAKFVSPSKAPTARRGISRARRDRPTTAPRTARTGGSDDDPASSCFSRAARCVRARRAPWPRFPRFWRRTRRRAGLSVEAGVAR